MNILKSLIVSSKSKSAIEHIFSSQIMKLLQNHTDTVKGKRCVLYYIIVVNVKIAL